MEADTGEVALRKESVDRNRMLLLMYLLKFGVALRKESVDRNNVRYPATALPSVALRKESVDRNTQRRDFKALGLLGRSPQGERG